MTTKWHQIAGKWKQFSGAIKLQWGNLTHNEHMMIIGNREILAGTIQERFGVTRLKTRPQIDERVDPLNT
jgi:uncharacterized protein YjbJ (UPF0337 family)